jgi:hypothetical protein
MMMRVLRSVSFILALAVVCSASASTVARGPRPFAAARQKAPPTFASCGEKAGASTSSALNAFIKKAQRFDTAAPTTARIAALGKATNKLNVKRAAAQARFLECIRPIAGSDALAVSRTSTGAAPATQVDAVPAIRVGAQAAPSSCVSSFTSAAQTALTTFNSNLRAIGVDDTFGGAIQTATVVIGDLDARLAGALAALGECLANALGPRPTGSSSEACGDAVTSSALSAQDQADARDDQIDGSSASEDVKALQKADAAVAFDAALNAATKAFLGCFKRAASGSRNASSGSGPALTLPVPQPCPPHCTPVPPPPPPAGPTVQECNDNYASFVDLARDAFEVGEFALAVGLTQGNPIAAGYGYLFILVGLEILKQAREAKTACLASVPNVT